MKKEDRISELMKGQFTQSGMGNSYMNKPDCCPHCGESLGEEAMESSAHEDAESAFEESAEHSDKNKLFKKPAMEISINVGKRKY